MGFLDNLDPRQRQMLMIGVPVVAGVVVVSKLAKGKSAPAAPTASLPAGTTPVASDAVIGVGQLAEFESLVTDRLNSFAKAPNAAGAGAAALPSVSFTGFAAQAGERAGDLVRDEQLLAGSSGGYVLDAWGGIHPFGTAPLIDKSTYGGYTPQQDTARKLVLDPSGKGGYTLDASGGVHPFKAAAA